MATTGGGRPRVRVRFVDEVGRHVLRQRGFSGCWFLVPDGARLVGDLAHALMVEFGLTARCPAGVDLAIDGLHVPANQDIAVVRDGDNITVQCASAIGPSSPAPERRRRLRELEDDESESLTIPLSPSLSSTDDSSACEEGREGKEEDLRRVMESLRSRHLALRRKGKAAKKAKASKRLKVETSKKAKLGKAKLKKKATFVTTTQSDSSSSDSSSETSSDSSIGINSETSSDSSIGISSDSSSSSDSDSSASSSGEGTTSTNGEGKTQAMVKRTPENGGVALKRQTQSNGGSKSGGEAVAVETEEQKPRRQRRRQRRRRRDRNSGSNAAPGEVPDDGAPASATGAVSATGTDSLILDNVAEPRREIRTRFPQSKAHFRFDNVNGEAVASGRPSDTPLDPHRAPTGLEKYGPSSSDGGFANGGPIGEKAGSGYADRVNGVTAGQRRRRQPEGGSAGNATDEGSAFAPQRKKAKTHRDEMWKRPYEVFASVLDKSQADNAVNKGVSSISRQ
jgi:hypothetical protein